MEERNKGQIGRTGLSNSFCSKPYFIYQDEKALVRAQAIARGWIARHRYAAMRKMKNQRDKLVFELVDTEKTYVDNLQIIVKLFLNPLRNKVKSDPTFMDTSKIRYLLISSSLTIQTVIF